MRSSILTRLEKLEKKLIVEEIEPVSIFIDCQSMRKGAPEEVSISRYVSGDLQWKIQAGETPEAFRTRAEDAARDLTGKEDIVLLGFQ